MYDSGSLSRGRAVFNRKGLEFAADTPGRVKHLCTSTRIDVKGSRAYALVLPVQGDNAENYSCGDFMVICANHYFSLGNFLKSLRDSTVRTGSSSLSRQRSRDLWEK